MNHYLDPRISRVIELETIITRAIIKGHRATYDDQFKEIREELKKLREELKIERKVGK